MTYLDLLEYKKNPTHAAVPLKGQTARYIYALFTAKQTEENNGRYPGRGIFSESFQ